MEKELTAKSPRREVREKGLWVLIPAHNEAANIATVVRGARRFVDRVLVVADGCTDATAEQACRAGAEVLELPACSGKGSALRAGWLWLADHADWNGVLLLDGDGQHDPAEIGNFLKAWKGEDMVLGMRRLDAPAMPWLRRATNRFMTASLRGLAGCPVEDSQCGFRLLSRDFALGEAWSSDHFEIESEMIWCAARRGWKVKQVPITVRYAAERSKICPWRDTVRWVRNCCAQSARRP
jgi:glycosyltransferase involved in cell wall biosynthesis